MVYNLICTLVSLGSNPKLKPTLLSISSWNILSQFITNKIMIECRILGEYKFTMLGGKARQLSSTNLGLVCQEHCKLCNLVRGKSKYDWVCFGLNYIVFIFALIKLWYFYQ